MNEQVNIERGLILVIGELRMLVEHLKDELKEKEELILILRNNLAKSINDLNK